MYRANDLDTSVEAAHSVDCTELEAVVLQELRRAGQDGRTLDELIAALKMDKVTISPRLRPLCNKGLAAASAERRMGLAGRRQTVWLAVL